jgi:hypothetical protein
MTVLWSRRHSVVVGERRGSIHAWKDRFRDPALTILLVLEICLIFLGAPLAAKGVPLARPIIETVVLALVVIVGMLSHGRGAIAAISARAGSHLGGRLARVGMAAGGSERTQPRCQNPHFLALSWVVSHAVYAPGRITFHRLQGAAVLI